MVASLKEWALSHSQQVHSLAEMVGRQLCLRSCKPAMNANVDFNLPSSAAEFSFFHEPVPVIQWLPIGMLVIPCCNPMSVKALLPAAEV